MRSATHRCVALLACMLTLTMLLGDVHAQANFPNPQNLAKTNVSLELEGFGFASGLKSGENGKPNGRGTELVPQRWCGSGFVIGKDGTIVTNYHVVRHALAGKALFPSGASYNIASIKAIDSHNDLALLKLGTSNTFPTVTLGKADKVDVLNKVLAVGNSLCQELAVTDGIINQLIRDPRTGEVVRFRHSAALTPGNSGGPLYKGSEVIGVNVATLPPWQVHYAIAISKLHPLLQRSKIINLKEAFPPDGQAIAKRFKTIDTAIGQIEPGSPSAPSVKAFRAMVPGLQDIAIVLEAPEHNLDLLIRDERGQVLGYGADPKKDYEVVFFANNHQQMIEALILNYSATAVRFGFHLLEIVWLEE